MEADGAVSLPKQEGIPGTSGGQGCETHLCQKPRRARVPRVGNDECRVALMQRTEGLSLLSLRQHSSILTYGTSTSRPMLCGPSRLATAAQQECRPIFP